MQWISSLDRLHDQKTSDEQYQQLCYLLADDVQARSKLVWIYQTQSRGDHWHPEGDLELLKRALDTHRFVGLGGMLSVIERDILRAQDILGIIGEILDEAGAEAHVFGVGNYPLLTYCLLQRWFRSADSARWIQGLRSRTLLTLDGNVMSGKKLSFTGLQCAEQNVASVLAWFQADRHQLYLLPHNDPPTEEEEPFQLSWVV